MNEPFDGKKLFIVEIEQSIMVLAKDRKEAESVARDHVDDLDWDDSYFAGYEGFQCGWEKAFPYGLEDMKQQTCSQIREAWDEYERNRPCTRAELEAKGQVPLIPETTEAI